MINSTVEIDGKKYNRATFEPRASRCSHCPLIAELEPKADDTVTCKLFKWLINRNHSKRDATCSSRTKPLAFSVILSDTESQFEREEKEVWE